MKIYYAHHQWKYNTPIEEYELKIIEIFFPKSKIINPSMIDFKTYSEEEIMKKCIAMVKQSDVLVFSCIGGVIGKGVKLEIESIRKEWTMENKKLFYIFNNTLIECLDVEYIKLPKEQRSDRLFANINIIGSYQNGDWF